MNEVILHFKMRTLRYNYNLSLSDQTFARLSTEMLLLIAQYEGNKHGH